MINIRKCIPRVGYTTKKSISEEKFMCEYTKDLEQFLPFQHHCPLSVEALVQAKDPFVSFLQCFENIPRGTIVYLFYREGDTVHNVVRLQLDKVRRSKRRLNKLLNTIIDVHVGTWDLFVFPNDSLYAEQTFHKLYELILERCETNKIERDYQIYFISGWTGLLKRFMLDTYMIVSENIFVVLGLVFFAFITFQYLALMNAGYPFELIDNNAVMFLGKYLLYGLAILTAIPLALTLLRTYFSTTFLSKRIGYEKFKITFVSILYILFFLIFIGKPVLDKPFQELFVRGYSAMHLFPRLGVDKNGDYKIVMGIKNRVTYYYDLDANSSLVRSIICNTKNSMYGVNNDLMTQIIFQAGAQGLLGSKKIQRLPFSKHFKTYDSNHSAALLHKRFCD